MSHLPPPPEAPRPIPPPPPGGGPPGPPHTGPDAVDRPFTDEVDRRSGRADDAFRVPFSVADAFVALAVYFFGQLVVGIAAAVGIAALGGDLEGSSTPLLVATVASQAVGLLFALGYLSLRRRLSWRVLGPVRPGALPVLLGLAVGFAGTILAYTINAGITLVFDPQTTVEQQLLDDVLAGGAATVIVVVAAVIMAPIAEELLFRGLLFQSLRRRLGVWFAAVASSAVFCVVHVEIIVSQPLALVGLFALGIVLAWSFHRTGSLVVPILGHAIFNAASLGVAVIADRLPIAAIVIGSGLVPVP